MLDNLLSVWGVVLFCSLVQSLFGVGLLMIGTPLLLLLDVPFRTALWLLLPASATISLLQLVVGPPIDRVLIRRVGTWALPSLVVGVFVGLNGMPALKLDLVIAVMLVASAAIRLNERLAARLRALSASSDSVMLAMIGFVHGLSNMGGAMLTAYAASRHADRHAMRETIAAAYFLFATMQLAVLGIFGGSMFGGVAILMVCTAAMTYLTFGKIAFRSISTTFFNQILTVLMLFMAAMLVMKSARVFG